MPRSESRVETPGEIIRPNQINTRNSERNNQKVMIIRRIFHGMEELEVKARESVDNLRVKEMA